MKKRECIGDEKKECNEKKRECIANEKKRSALRMK